MILNGKKIYNVPQIHILKLTNYDCICASPVGVDFIWDDSSLNDDWS